MVIEMLLSENESDRLEFKESIPSNDKIGALLCAFANTVGGDLVVGVEDGTRRLTGVPEKTILEIEEKIATIAANNISPVIFPIIKSIRFKGVTLLHVHVDMGHQKPYRIATGLNKGKVFVRIGSTTRQADRATEQAMQLRSHGISWDNMACAQCSIADLDKSLIEEYLELRQQRRDISKPAKIDTKWLVKMHFAVQIRDEIRPTNGGVLLFTKTPQDIFPATTLELARFAGSSGRDFIDKQSLTGPPWKLYDESRKFFRRHINVSAPRSHYARLETPEYPELVFREFMVNALCHRSYENSASSIRCAIFDDTIQITNPGTLPEGLELSDLGTGISVIRNPLIARVLNEIGLIEGWGTGISIAQQELSRLHLPPAKIDIKGFFIQVTSKWRWSNNLSRNEDVIVKMIASKGKVSSAMIARNLELTDRAVRKILGKMIQKQLLIKNGNTKGVLYGLK